MRLEDEHIYHPQYGAFIPFSSGPRVCPGKKFAQVEFVAVIARLFRRHRCSPVLLKGETMVEAKKRVFTEAPKGLTAKHMDYGSRNME